MAINMHFNDIEEARDFIRETQRQLNPSKTVLKKKLLDVVVGNRKDYDLLKEGLFGMKNAKWIGVVLDADNETNNQY